MSVHPVGLALRARPLADQTERYPVSANLIRSLPDRTGMVWAWQVQTGRGGLCGWHHLRRDPTSGNPYIATGNINSLARQTVRINPSLDAFNGFAKSRNYIWHWNCINYRRLLPMKLLRWQNQPLDLVT